MKKILEVLQYGDGELRFNTDLDVSKDPMAISPDRKIILNGLGKEAEKIGDEFIKMMKTLQDQGEAMTFPPCVRPPMSKNKN